MLQIKSIQAEHEHMILFFSGFTEDSISSTGRHAYNKEILWSVVDEAFDPTEHEFFKNAKEMNQSGFVNMFECYEIGIGCSSTATAPVSMITTQPKILIDELELSQRHLKFEYGKELKIDTLGNSYHVDCIQPCLPYAFGQCSQLHPETCAKCENLENLFAKL
ncbi:13263_t:CDS:2, partial [Entrophospora sp. SA101]